MIVASTVYIPIVFGGIHYLTIIPTETDRFVCAVTGRWSWLQEIMDRPALGIIFLYKRIVISAVHRARSTLAFDVKPSHPLQGKVSPPVVIIMRKMPTRSLTGEELLQRTCKPHQANVENMGSWHRGSAHALHCIVVCMRSRVQIPQCPFFLATGESSHWTLFLC